MLAERIEQWIKQGEQRGQEQGIVIGLEQGQQEQLQKRREDVHRQLRRRFGDLPARAEAQLAGADSDDLDRWIDAVVVTSLEGIIGPEAHGTHSLNG